MSQETKKQWSRKKKVIFWAVFALAVFFTANYFGYGLTYRPDVVDSSEGRLVTRARYNYNKNARNLDKLAKTDYDEAARQLADEKVLLAHNEEMATNYRKNCPDNSRWDDPVEMKIKTMDLSGCNVGTVFGVQLADPYKAEDYAVALYNFDQGEPETEVEKMVGKKLSLLLLVEPELTSQCGAEQIGDNLYRLCGLPFFKYNGNADMLVLVRQTS